ERKDDHEALCVNVKWQTLRHSGHARMVGSGLVDGDAQKTRKRSAIAAAPRDTTLPSDALEVTDEDHAEIDARRNRGPPQGGGIVRLTAFFDPAIELSFCQKLIQLLIERMPRRLRQLRRRDPQSLLLALAFSQRH